MSILKLHISKCRVKLYNISRWIKDHLGLCITTYGERINIFSVVQVVLLGGNILLFYIEVKYGLKRCI